MTTTPAVGTTVQFVTTAKGMAQHTGTVTEDEGNGFVKVAVTASQTLGGPVREFATPRAYTVPASEVHAV